MKLKNLFHITIIFFLTFNSCKQEKIKESTSSDMLIRLSADSTAIELHNIPAYIIDEFQADSLQNSQWENFFAVYEDIPDHEMRDFQPALEGSYVIVDGLVRFKPGADFRKEASYFARCYTKSLLREPQNIISSRKLFSTGEFIEYRFKILR